MESLFLSKIKSIGQFSNEELDALQEATLIRQIEKGEALLLENAICQAMWFLEQGAVYQYQSKEQKVKEIIGLYLPEDWIINVQSFTTQRPSKSIIKAYQDSLIYELKIEKVHQLIRLSPSYLQLGKCLGLATERTQFIKQLTTPDQKYRYLQDHLPDLLQSFPQYMIASYLNITPETLSRVRKRMIS